VKNGSIPAKIENLSASRILLLFSFLHKKFQTLCGERQRNTHRGVPVQKYVDFSSAFSLQKQLSKALVNICHEE
jgi:hypothetical protein